MQIFRFCKLFIFLSLEFGWVLLLYRKNYLFKAYFVQNNKRIMSIMVRALTKSSRLVVKKWSRRDTLVLFTVFGKMLPFSGKLWLFLSANDTAGNNIFIPGQPTRSAFFTVTKTPIKVVYQFPDEESRVQEVVPTNAAQIARRLSSKMINCRRNQQQGCFLSIILLRINGQSKSLLQN